MIALAVNQLQDAGKDAGQPYLLFRAGLGGEFVEQAIGLIERRTPRREFLRQCGGFGIVVPGAGFGKVRSRPDGGGADGRRPPLQARPVWIRASGGRRLGERRAAMPIQQQQAG